MKQTLENTENLKIRQNEVTEILVEDGKVTGVVTHSEAIFRCKAVVLCMGTYMKARCLYGETIMDCGPNGLMNATKLSQNLMDLGMLYPRATRASTASLLPSAAAVSEPASSCT